jgi:molybdopterin-guanine dinucleotide biosynthesis protein B
MNLPSRPFPNASIARRMALGSSRGLCMTEPKRFGFAGWSGSGKTTLIEKVIPRLLARGVRVSLVKHAHHDFDVDQPGKDSWRHREAGCSEVLLVSRRRVALMQELRGEAEPTLDACIARLSPCDLVLVEGYKHGALPKLETWRGVQGKPLLHPQDPHIVAVASDAPVATSLPRYSLDDAQGIAEFILQHTGLTEHGTMK